MPPAAQGCFPFSEMWRGLRRHVLPGLRPKRRVAEGCPGRNVSEDAGTATRGVSPFGFGGAASLAGHVLIVLLALAWCNAETDTGGEAPVLEVDLGEIAGGLPQGSGAARGKASPGGAKASPAKTPAAKAPVTADVLVRDKTARVEPAQKPAEHAAEAASGNAGTAEGNAREGAAGGAGSGSGGQGVSSGHGGGQGTGGISGGAGAGTVDHLPRILEKVKPLYPEHARRQHKTGVVTLKFLVDAEGRVHHPSVTEASPQGMFEESALAAIVRWRFAPAMRQGRPVPTWLILPVRFTLE